MAQIQDYGDKVGGARKDIFSDYLLRLSSEISEDVNGLRQMSLSEAFPKPDYLGLEDRGISKTCLAAICAARGAIDRKPVGRSATARAMTSWLNQINLGKSIAIIALDFDSQGQDLDRRVIHKMAQQAEATRLTFRIMIDVPTESLNGAEALSVHRYRGDLVLVNQGKKILARHPEAPGTEEAAHARMVSGIIENSSKEIAAPKRRTPEERAAEIAKKIRIYGKSSLSVELRTNGGRLVLQDGFSDLKTARQWCAANRQEIRARIMATMGERSERTGLYRDRQGPARRDGNMSPAGMAERFGLRAVEFGNYVEGQRRQKDLNDMTDGFADLAEALGIPERLIGYDGALAVAFGARGGGHFAAHYEPDRRVFNLTKSSGAGSAAHEWLHSADNAAAMRNACDKDERTTGMMSVGTGHVVAALKEAWKGYEARMSAFDASRTKPYWSKPVELCARSFETWLVGKLDDLGIVNDHLVEIDASSEVYPTKEEMEAIGPAMDRFVREMTGKLLMDAGMERVAAPDRQAEATPIATRETLAAVAAIPTSIDDFDDREPEFDF